MAKVPPLRKAPAVGKPVTPALPVAATEALSAREVFAPKPAVATPAAATNKPPMMPPVAPTSTITPDPAPPLPVPPQAAPPEAFPSNKDTTMNETINTMQNAAHTATEHASAAFGDVNARAKDAVAKGTKAIEELVEFSKGNMEAVVASGRVAAKGAEDIAKYAADYGRSTVEKANATAKQFAAVKSPTEFFQLQGDVAKQTLDAIVAEASKFTENYLKLVGEMTQPLSNRYAEAAEKVKSTTSL